MNGNDSPSTMSEVREKLSPIPATRMPGAPSGLRGQVEAGQRRIAQPQAMGRHVGVRIRKDLAPRDKTMPILARQIDRFRTS